MALASPSWPWREISQIICSSTKLAETVLVFKNWTSQGLRYLWWIEHYDFIMWCWTYCLGCDRLWDCLSAICRSWADLPQMLEQREDGGAAEEVLNWSNHGCNCPHLLFSRSMRAFPHPHFDKQIPDQQVRELFKQIRGEKKYVLWTKLPRRRTPPPLLFKGHTFPVSGCLKNSLPFKI